MKEAEIKSKYGAHEGMQNRAVIMNCALWKIKLANFS